METPLRGARKGHGKRKLPAAPDGSVLVDEQKIFDLASVYCTKVEIASSVGCSVDTLDRRFADLIQKGYAEARQSLRRMQWKAAREGNIVMLIWLGKQWLNQKEPMKETELSQTTVLTISQEKVKEEIVKLAQVIGTHEEVKAFQSADCTPVIGLLSETT